MIVRILALLILLSPVASWATSVPSTVGWHAIANTSLQSVCPANGFGGSGYGFSDNCPNVTAAWNSGAWDSLRNRLYVWGGGHADYAGNELYAIDLDNGSRTRLTDPSVPVAGSCVEGLTNPTAPNSRHTYGGLTYDENADRVIVVSGSLACATANSSIGIWAYNPTANTWQNMGTFASLTSGFTANDIEGTTIAYDSVSASVWIDTRIALFQYVFATNTLTSRNDQGGHYRGQDLYGYIDRKARKFHVLGGGEHHIWNITTPTSVPAPTNGATNTCTTAAWPGLAYDYDFYQLVCWPGGNSIYRYNDAANTWTTVTFSGGPSPMANGTYGRFAYSQTEHAFVVYNDMSANLSALRTVAAGDADWNYRSTAAGVTFAEGFDTIGDYTIGNKARAGDGGFDGTDMDTTIKTSGTGALRFNLPAGRATSDISGHWYSNLKTDGSGFGAGQTWYYQYRVRITPSMVTNLAQWQSGTDTGWKTLILHNGSITCSSVELTQTTYQYSGGIGAQIWYSRCGNYQNFMTNGGVQSGSGPWIQQGSNVASKTDGYWCDFNNLVDGSGNGTGCFNWQHTNEWVTFYGKVTINNFTSSNGTWQVWLARDGATSYTQVMDMEGIYQFEADGGINTYNRATFTPYMTNLNVGGAANANMWIDEFIVSTNPIPVPGTTGAAAPDPPAPSPGRFQLSLNLRR